MSSSNICSSATISIRDNVKHCVEPGDDLMKVWCALTLLKNWSFVGGKVHSLIAKRNNFLHQAHIDTHSFHAAFISTR
jgi:hypothetical protein